MIALESNCKMLFTDSGGVQKEAYFFKKPVVVMRSETEWKEIIDEGCGIISNADTENIINAYNHFQNIENLSYPPIFGNGHASELILKKIIENR
jgi:UDP-GlcNAc3NAcA epimerase